MNKNKSYIAAFGYSLFVGLSFLITKLVVPYASPMLILAHRFTISLGVFLLFLVFTKPKIEMTRKKILAILPITLFYPLLFFALQVYGLKSASSSEAGIIFATVLILTIIISALFGNHPSKTQSLCIILSVTGVILIFTKTFPL